jgi:phospholipase C
MRRYIVGYPQNTIYNNLAESGISWANYFQEVPSLLVFDQLRTSISNYHQWDTFLSDAKAGTLPSVSFLDPSYFSILNCVQENDNHPPADVAEGEALLKQVYETLRASPQWNQTLFIVTYDEHGG